MTESSKRRLREESLEQINALLAHTPDMVEARFNRACLLVELGHTEEAKAAYIELLKDVPTHFGALNNFGNLLYAQGYREAARTLYTEAVIHHSQNPKGHVNLANLLAAHNEPAKATEHFEEALRLDPDHPEANRGLSYLLTESRDEERASHHRQKAFQQEPVLLLPYTGKDEPIAVLLLVSASGGTIPMRHHFDESLFLVSVLFVEFYDETVPLPVHQLVVNAIGDADLCRPALEAAIRITSKTSAPVINPPDHVIPTGRCENAARLGGIPHVIAPKTALMPRSLLEAPGAAVMLAREGFSFPLLLRAPGFHTGRHFIRVDNTEALTESLPAMPGEEQLVIQYLDTRAHDGKIRKYRVMMIDGMLYPLHVAISHEWKIHYFTAEMADNPGHRAEDAAFLADMPGVLGPRAMQALEQICAVLALDYGGIDFGLSAEGDIVLYEANATMVVYPPDKDPRWDYRRAAVKRILDAIQHLLTGQKELPALQDLLTRGGDARIMPNTEGINKYGCSAVPQSGVMAFSSSTASTISAGGFAASAALYKRLKESTEPPQIIYEREMNRVRDELTAFCGLDDLAGLNIVFGASGTDLHLFTAQLLGASEPLLVIMPEAAETGSGVGSALKGQHFSTRTAQGSAVIAGEAIAGGNEVAVENIASREADGTLRPEAQVEAEIETLVQQAIAAGNHVLLILTDISKTGLIIPSIAFVMKVKRRFGEKLDVLVDGCQFRLSAATIRDYLENGFLLAVTGSKFVTGPAFCASLLVPDTSVQRLRSRTLPVSLSAYSAKADWLQGWKARAALSDTANFGLLLRFEAALAEMHAFRALPETHLQPFLETFAEAIQKRLADDPVFVPVPVRKINREPLVVSKSWDNVQTIFPFLLRHPASGTVFSRDETTRIYALLQQDLSNHADIPPAATKLAATPCLPGQPVECGQTGALRLSIDMRLIVSALSNDGCGADTVISQALTVLDKAALVARHFFKNVA